MMKNLILILTLLFLANTAQADASSANLPLASELLANPVRLKCGAVIREWRGSQINSDRVNRICSTAKLAFKPFVRELGYSPNNKPFRFSMSFIPYGRNYRDLNDVDYRFAGRNLGTQVTGYTVHDDRYLFNLSDVNDRDFDVSLGHELFHAMSYHYGVFHQHKGSESDIDETEERLARKFTKRLMGRE